MQGALALSSSTTMSPRLVPSVMVFVAGLSLTFAGGMPTSLVAPPVVSATYSQVPVAASYGLGCAAGAAEAVSCGAEAVGEAAASVGSSPPPSSATAATMPPTTTTTPTVEPMMAVRLLRCSRSRRR